MRDQAIIDAAQAKIDAARESLAKAQRSFHAVYSRQSKIMAAEFAKDDITLESALVENLDGRTMHNADGYKFLQDLAWQGAWKGLGVRASGSYYMHLNQRVVQISLKRVMPDSDLARLEKVLRDEVIPVLKPGALAQGRTGRSDEEFATAKVIDIMDEDLSETRDPQLLVLDDGTCKVINLRYYRKGDKPLVEGTLKQCLEFIRERLYYEVG